MFTPVFANKFKKDYLLMEKRRKNMDKIMDVMALVMWGEPLPEKYREHGLSGIYTGFIECHIEPDWLLIYRFAADCIYFARTGTHSDLL
jgi:mRNA interferase YafQ